MNVHHKKRILVAPLNWGLGHATRCMPIINALLANNFEPVIASDGYALSLLKKEYPNLQFFELPSYNITYAKKGNSFKIKIVKDSPHLLKTIKREKKAIQELTKSEDISGIISDNRFGVRQKHIPSVFITHQLRVLSGNTTWLSSKFHQKIISKFDQCWIPDHRGKNNLSGELGHVKDYQSSLKYLGPLSRFKKQKLPLRYNLLIILSGPEPQRTYLEEKLFIQLENYKGKVCFVKGILESEQKKFEKNNITVYNYMTSVELEKALNKCEMVLSRSGYTSLMDYAKLEKKAFLIPTPGQFEQEYLAKKLQSEGIAPSCNQKLFKIEMLKDIENYSGFKSLEDDVNYQELFRLF
ncbi:glycosyltransferase [Winogradskyella sp. PE311]|uniref:glycosyltransferase n=1 Tax=Winogradskyella sp. PE311 TaxID=3366943 RepID=UPI00397FAE5A